MSSVANIQKTNTQQEKTKKYDIYLRILLMTIIELQVIRKR